MMAEAAEADAAFGASHTSFYTSAVAKDSYATIEDILSTKMKDEGVREVVTEMLAACVKITEALRVNLVTVADAQNSVFGDVQLGVDVLADELMWEACKKSKLVREGASEEEPVMVETNKDGRFTICWDPLDGSSIVDNNWAVGTMIGTPSLPLFSLLSLPPTPPSLPLQLPPSFLPTPSKSLPAPPPTPHPCTLPYALSCPTPRLLTSQQPQDKSIMHTVTIHLTAIFSFSRKRSI